jgi:hypothetical protein
MLRLHLSVVFVFLLFASGAGSGVLEEEDFLITSDFSFSDQNNPAVAVGLGGKFAVVWVDRRNGNGDIFCQLYDSTFIPTGDNFRINDDDIAAWQFEPDLSSDWYGNYFAVWKDYRNGAYPFDPDIYYQKLDSTGFVGINRNITIEPPDSSHQSPAVGAAGWGKAIVAWTDLRYRNWDVFVQPLDNNGNPLGVNIMVNDDYSTSPQHEPEVALSPEGWFVVVWYDGRNGDDDIYLQKFDSAGNPVGENIIVNHGTIATKQKFPSAAISGNGIIYIVWTDWRYGNYPANSDIFCQRFDSDLNRLGANFIINQDGTSASQRDPKVAADRMGNACIVWSDSAGGDWNVVGQMIEYSGCLRDNNFRVNSEKSGKQLLPDVAIDGYDLYLVWADNRNGDYDIYGRIIRYNNPALLASPERIDYSKDMFDPDPEPFRVTLQNAGYGELDYRLQPEQDWIELSQTTGFTPDSFYVILNSNSLDYGIHQGRITLIDLTHYDSTAIIPVALTITGPQIELEPDSLSFRALIEIGPPPDQIFAVLNTGTGALDWVLTETADWLAVDKTNGAADEVISVGCDITSLLSGEYEAYAIISDSSALNGPESLKVILDLQSNIPYLAAQPDSIYYFLIRGETVKDSIQILNWGGNVSHWHAGSDASWLSLVSSSGADYDFASYSIATAGLIPGQYRGSIKIQDSTAFNNPIHIPIVVDLYPPDTVLITPAAAELGDFMQVQLYLHNQNSIRRGYLMFAYDDAMHTVDSILPPSEGDLEERVLATIDDGANTFILEIPVDSLETPIGAGPHHLADLYGTVNDSITGITFFSIADKDSFYLESGDSIYCLPFLECGGLEISSPTCVDDRGRDNLPASFSLGQNFPNPFNNRTSISFDLKRAGSAIIEVYNILGQRVATLMDDFLPAGSYHTAWDGTDYRGREMASGIYFYKLQALDFSAVRKMVYLR